MAGNQLPARHGPARLKSRCTRQAATPEWWKGRRFDHGVTILLQAQKARAYARRRATIADRRSSRRKRVGHRRNSKGRAARLEQKAPGTANALDTVVVRHVSGGSSTILFKSYDQGRGKWQANTVHVVWFDEEPPFDVYSEGHTHDSDTGHYPRHLHAAPRYISSRQALPQREEREPRGDRHDDPRRTAHSRKGTRSHHCGLSAHRRDARANGVPTMGAGAVFPVADDDLLIDPIPIPNGGGGSGV